MTIAKARSDASNSSNIQKTKTSDYTKTDEVIANLNDHHAKEFEVLQRRLIATSFEADQLRMKLSRFVKGKEQIEVNELNVSLKKKKYIKKQKDIFYSVVRFLTNFILLVRIRDKILFTMEKHLNFISSVSFFLHRVRLFS